MTSTDTVELGVQISKDKMSAVMSIPAGYPPDMLSFEVCIAQLEAQNVAINALLRKQIEEGVSTFLADSEETVRVLLTGSAPTNGTDGYLRLSEECQEPQIDSSMTSQDGDQPEGATAIDHYARSPYILIEENQIIGKVIEPTDGQDGVNITGAAIPARPGKPFQLTPHESILLDAKGNIIAQNSGTLEVYGTNVRVNNVLRIDGQIDFETGHVNFDGDVEIAKGICDNFKVFVSRNAVIQGVVEAAELDIGGNLKLITGMFAKDKGRLKSGQTCHAKFLQQTHVHTIGDLIVDREIVNCEIVVQGSIVSPHATLIGGESHALRSVELKAMGSEQGIHTILHIGSLPQYNRLKAYAVDKLEELLTNATKIQKQIDMMDAGGTRIASQHKEDMTELWCDQMAAQEKHDKLKEQFDALTERYEAARDPQVTIHQMICAESRMIFDRTSAYFVKEVRGPITITIDKLGEFSYRQGSNGPVKPLRNIARIEHWQGVTRPIQ